MAFGRHSHVHLCKPDLVNLAIAYGCHAEKVDRSEDFMGILKKLLQQKDRPSVIVVPVDYSENMKLFRHLKDVVK
jgi:acetolactate synthase I/II/III large subunit